MNSNPSKADYVFGKGPSGWGYYHKDTQEAYKIVPPFPLPLLRPSSAPFSP